MGKIAILNKYGFTLVEILVSMVIILVVFVALLKALTIYTKNNVENEVRNTAINVAENCYEKLSSLQRCKDMPVKIRSFSLIYHIDVDKDIDNLTPGAHSVTITVSYLYPKGTIGKCSDDPSKQCRSDSDCSDGYCFNHQYIMNSVIYK